ncbi:glucose-1-phosphate thymidylyltransferase [Thalassobacillus pellis]|uniref:glucose-1-phosphate thymidylyltransferase n=1 Tax=Thalassobacillus pellis TaxID=748008 RepID=UPI00196160BD|nr:glucose-1-phosphate thymidylyltransferase [Thalassobacillus pellis]MBM7553323.1 glucose-1-phosphate thymidylyltransferase [Thalassobacillus pellis]
MKGLILTAGNGTRLRPLSQTKPKPLLPVANRPVISYGIEQLSNLGIQDIGLVIKPQQEELFRKSLHAYTNKNVRIHYIYQQEPKGIAHAVAQAEDFIGSDPMVLLLGDNLIDEPLDLIQESFQKESTHGTVMVTEVSKPEDYGIAKIKDNKIIELEEKPKEPKSNLAVIGAYMFQPTIFKAIHAISPSARGEYEITDAIQWMIDQGYTINHVKTTKPTFDVGTIDRWLEANQWMLKHYSRTTDDDFIDSKTDGSVIIPPVDIGENCTIDNSVIGPYVSIESDAIVKNCVLKNSILLKGSHLENIPYEITDSIFGEKAVIVGLDGDEEVMHLVFGDESKVIITNDRTKKHDNTE